MTITKFNTRPFEGTLNNLVDDFFADFPSLFKKDFNNSERKGFVPVNVKETEKAFVLDVVAPGFEKADFNVGIEQNLLTITAEKKEEVKQENEKQIRREFGFRSFKRTFTLDEKIDASNISASYVNGVLTLNLPKKEPVKPLTTQIAIN